MLWEAEISVRSRARAQTLDEPLVLGLAPQRVEGVRALKRGRVFEPLLERGAEGGERPLPVGVLGVRDGQLEEELRAVGRDLGGDLKRFDDFGRARAALEQVRDLLVEVRRRLIERTPRDAPLARVGLGLRLRA